MRFNAVWAIAPVSLLLLAKPAEAHFHLDEPPSNVTQNGSGDPQKPGSLTDACPAGTASGMTTQVRAGGQVKVKITETVAHGGHYRVSFAANATAFTFPQTVAAGNQCMSTTIANPVTPPILADGLFVHDQTAANAKNFCNGTATCEQSVTIPAGTTPGNYVMQVIEWMLPHGSAANNGIYGCFYAHCANIQVVDENTEIADGGVVVSDAGGTTSSSGTSGTPDGDDPEGESGSSSSGNGSKRRSSTPDDSGGCDVSAASGANLCAPLLGALVAVRMLRRRKTQADARN